MKTYTYEEIMQEVMTMTSEVLGIRPDRMKEDDDFINDLGADSHLKERLFLMVEDFFKKEIEAKARGRIETPKELAGYFINWLS